MGKVDVCILTILTLGTAVSGGRLGDDAQQLHRAPPADRNVTCTLGHSCSLPCPFEGEFKEGSWKRPDDPFLTIVMEPPIQDVPRHYDYRNIASLFVQQPGEGAVLVIGDVDMKHQGLHQCKVTSSVGDTDYFVDLRVHTPVLKVSLRQEGQQLLCSSEGIYPEPTVTWTPLSDSDEPRTSASVNGTNEGLFNIFSSVTLPPDSTAKSYTCNISTPYSWNSTSITPPRPVKSLDNLKYLWILLALPVALVALLIHFRHKLPGVKKLSKKDNPPASVAESESTMPLRQQNGPPNGLDHETSV